MDPVVACVLNTITEILAASAEIRRHEVYPIRLRQLNTTRISLLTVGSTREGTQFCPSPCWIHYLPSQNLFGKR